MPFGPIEEAFIEVTAKTDSADRDLAQLQGELRDTARVAEGVGEQIESSFREAGRVADRELASASRSMGLNFAAVVAGAAATAVGVGLIVSEFSNLEQSVGATEAIFGDASGEIDRFAQTSVDSVGLAESQFRTLSATTAGLLTNLGFTADEAADVAINLAQIGADSAATFGGSTKDAVDAFTAALRGEFEQAEQFGISLRQATVDAKAVELGLADSTSAVDANARAVATLTLIQEQATQVAGQFGREEETIAGQLQRLTGEARNAAAAVGEQLAPQVLELFQAAREDLLPALVSLAEQALPAVLDAVLALAPAAVGLVDVVTGLTPALELVSAVLEALPPEVITLTTAFFALRTAAGFVNTATASLARSLPAAAGAVTGLGAAVGLAGVALVAYSVLTADAREHQRELEAQVTATSQVLADSTSALAGVTEGIESFVDSETELTAAVSLARDTSVETADVLRDLGLSSAEAADLFLEGRDAVTEFLQASSASEEAGQQFAELFHAMQDSAEEALELAVANGTLTQSQFDAIEATGDWLTGLDLLADAQEAAQEAADRAAEAERRHVDALREAEERTAALTEVQDLLGANLTRVLDGVGDANTEFVSLALAADDAGLSEEQLATLSGELGVSLSDLAPLIDGVNAAFDGFVSDVEGSIPTIAGSIGALDEITFTNLHQAFADTFAEVQQFSADLAVLAAFPQVQAIAAQSGPEVARVLAQGFQDGHVAALTEMNQLALDTAVVEEQIRAEAEIFAQAFVQELLNAGVLSTDAFQLNFHPETSAVSRMADATNAVRRSEAGLSVAGSSAGGSASSGFASGVAPVSTEAANAVARSIQGMIDADTYSGPFGVGANVTQGFIAGLNSESARVAAAANAIARSATDAMNSALQVGSPSKVFMEIGHDVVEGFALGIDQGDRLVTQRIEALVGTTVGAAGAVNASPLASSSASVLNINLGGVTFSGVTSEQDARRAGEAMADGIAMTLARRRVRTEARIAV